MVWIDYCFSTKIPSLTGSESNINQSDHKYNCVGNLLILLHQLNTFWINRANMEVYTRLNWSTLFLLDCLDNVFHANIYLSFFVCTTNPVLVKFLVVVTGLSLLPEAGLKLCSLQSHVLQAAVHLCFDLLALHGKSCQHVGFSTFATVSAMSVCCLGLPDCQTKTHI